MSLGARIIISCWNWRSRCIYKWLFRGEDLCQAFRISWLQSDHEIKQNKIVLGVGSLNDRTEWTLEQWISILLFGGPKYLFLFPEAQWVLFYHNEVVLHHIIWPLYCPTKTFQRSVEMKRQLIKLYFYNLYKSKDFFAF